MGPPHRPETSSFARFGSSSRHVHCIINEITGAIYEADSHFLSGLFLVLPPSSQGEDSEAAVRIPIQAFNKAFNEGFVGPADYATEDWNHINPLGGRDRGREVTLKTVRAVHQTFLKGATESIDDIDVRFASEDVAVATVTSTSNPFTSPDGVKGLEWRETSGHLSSSSVADAG
jgi:hypothetical protein